MQDVATLNVYAARGVAVREFPLHRGHGVADYLLYVDGRAAGVVEAKPEGHTLTGVEAQSGKRELWIKKGHQWLRRGILLNANPLRGVPG